jgi:hypothetical protein
MLASFIYFKQKTYYLLSSIKDNTTQHERIQDKTAGYLGDKHISLKLC